MSPPPFQFVVGSRWPGWDSNWSFCLRFHCHALREGFNSYGSTTRPRGSGECQSFKCAEQGCGVKVLLEPSSSSEDPRATIVQASLAHNHPLVLKEDAKARLDAWVEQCDEELRLRALGQLKKLKKGYDFQLVSDATTPIYETLAMQTEILDDIGKILGHKVLEWMRGRSEVGGGSWRWTRGDEREQSGLTFTSRSQARTLVARLDSLGYSEAQELLDLLHRDPGQLETRVLARLLPFADTDPSYLVPLPPSPDPSTSSISEVVYTGTTTPDLVHLASPAPSTMSEYSGMSRSLQQQVLATLDSLSTTTWQEWERELPKLVAASSGVPEADLFFADATKKAEYARWKRMTDSLILILKLQGGPDVQGRLVDFDSKRGDLPSLWANLKKWYGNTTVGAERVVGTQKLVTERWDGDESPSLYFSRLKGLQNRVNAAYREDAKVATNQADKNVIADLNAAISDNFLRDLILATLPESYAEPLLPSISRTTSLDDLKNLVTNLYLSRQSRGDIADLDAARRTSAPPTPAPAQQQQQRTSAQQQRQGGGNRDTKSQKPKKAATLYPSYEQWHGGTFVNRNNITRFSIPYMTCYQCFQHGHVAKDCKTGDKARSRVKELAKDGVKVPIGDAMALWAFDTNPGGQTPDQAAVDALRALVAHSTSPPPPSDQPAKAQFVTVVDSVDTTPRAFLVSDVADASALHVVAKQDYVVDSGATRHFCSIREHLHDYRPYATPHPITGVFGSAGSGLGEGRVVFRFPDGDISISNVMYAPDLGVNLLSQTQLMLKGMRFTNDRTTLTAVDEAGRRIWQLPVGTSIAVPASRVVRPPRSSLALAAQDTADLAMRRHRRLGHLSDQRAKKLEGGSVGLDAIDTSATSVCDACEKAKATRKPHPSTASNPPSKRLEVISADTWGPAPIGGIKGERFALALVDQKTRYLWGKALRSKGGITDVVIERLKKVERQSGDKVGSLQTDNGTEFVNKTMASFTTSAGIQHRRSIPYNHTQNGFIERRFRSLFESVRAMLLDSGLPTSLWPYAYESAIYLSNRSPTSVLGGKTPYEAFHGAAPDLSNLRAWGCSAYLRLAPEGPNAPHKLAARGVHARFIGYPEDNKGWILWVPEWRKIVVGWDVKFYESTFGKARDADDEAGHEGWLEEMVELEAREGTREGGMDGRKDTPAPPFASPNPFQPLANNHDDAGSDDGYESAPEDTLSSPSPSRRSSPSPPPIPLPTVSPPRTEVVVPEPERRLTRTTGLQPTHFVPQQGAPGTPGASWGVPPSTMSDAEVDAHNNALARRVDAVALSTFSGDSPTRPPLNMLDYARLDLDLDRNARAVAYTAFECSVDAGHSEVIGAIERALATGPPWSGSHDQPTYKQALSRPDAEKWLDAMHVELAAFSATGTWDEELVDLPAGRKAIAVKWVLLIKRDANGHVIKYKARLVARGDQQVEGVDYDETHSSTVRLTTVRLIFALLAHCRHFNFKQFDISNAYLLGGLDREIYIQQAPGFVDSGRPRAVRRLRSALYGLKQGGREWQKVLRGALERIGFRRSAADHGLYIRRRNGKVAYVPTHVDDGLVVGDDDLGQVLVDLDKELGGKLKEVETGLFLGMRIRRGKDGKVSLDQGHYTRSVLERFFPNGLSPVSTPLDSDYSGVAAATEDERHSCEYRELLGALVYLAACTRPDLSFALSFASRFAACPAERHWRLLVRICRYLSGTADLALVYFPSDVAFTPDLLTGWTDADHAADRETRKSVSGFVFTVGRDSAFSSAISWQSRRQRSVAISSTEAEYMALSEAAREAVWLRWLMDEMGFPTHDQATTIRGDNSGSLLLASHPTSHSRTKHISVHYHYSRDLVENGTLVLKWVKTDDMVADVFTKALPTVKHVLFTSRCGLRHVPREGGR